MSQQDNAPAPNRRYDTDLSALVTDVKVETYRSGGPGGQKRNKTETAVRLTHLPSGITVIATEHRSQTKNRALAFLRLQHRLRQLNRRSRQRVATSPPPGAISRQEESKRRQSVKKGLRQPPAGDGDGA